MSVQPHRRLERPQQRMIAGVCSGLGEYFDIDPVLVRIAFVVLTVLGGAGILVYLILWIIMPTAGSTVALGAAGVGEGFRTMATELKDVGRDIRNSMGGSAQPPPPPPPPPPYGAFPAGAGTHRASHRHDRGLPVLGVLFIVLGVWLLLGNFGLLDWASARYVWPAFLVALGLFLLVRRLR